VGSTIEDVDGNRYVDYVMSWGPLIHGHAPKGLVKAINGHGQARDELWSTQPLENELGVLVRKLVPSMERVRFVSSGTEAAMSAVRLARAFTGRDRIIKFEGCYHGHGDAFLVKAGSGATTLGIPTSPGVPAAVVADTLLARYNDLDSVSQLCAAHEGSIAALIVEPIAGNMGLVPPATGFCADCASCCSRHGIVLIFDEVISGFRASAGGAQGVYGIRPDLTCLGKIIGGGLPWARTADGPKLWRRSRPPVLSIKAGTLSGNPIAMTAGIWALERLSPRLYKDLARLGTTLAAGLADAARARRRAAAGQRTGLAADTVLHLQPRPRLQLGASVEYGRVCCVLPRNARARRLSPPSQFEAWFLSAATRIGTSGRRSRPQKVRCRMSRGCESAIGARSAVQSAPMAPIAPLARVAPLTSLDRDRRIEPHAQDRSLRQVDFLPFGRRE
jgi:glutamate-1-semialdehyde 2,1-aminomutase